MIDFTVAIPVFNTKPAELLEAVYSIINQSIKQDFEIVIVDDCSNNEETKEALNFFDSKVFKVGDNKRKISIVRIVQKNGGTSSALNIAHDIIKSEYIAIMGSDDISHPDRFEKQIKHLEKNPQIDVLGTNLFSFYEDDIFRKQIFVSKHPYRVVATKSTWLTNHGTVIYKNKEVKKIGGYDETKRRAQDIDLFLRLYAAGKIICNLPDVLYAWRRRK